MCSGDLVGVQDIQLSSLGTPQSDVLVDPAQQRSFRELTLDVLEQEYIMATLEQTNWNKSQAAAILGIERSTLDRKIRRYELIEAPRNSTS